MRRSYFVVAAAVFLSAAAFVESHSPRSGVPISQVERHRAVVTGPAGEEIVEIYGFSHEIVSPRDAASGLPTGKRQHKPFSITKPVDKASGLLLESMLTSERIPSVVVTSFVRKRGRWVPFRIIRLDEVFVASVGQEPVASSSGGDTTVSEEVAFYYNKITWEYEESGTEHTDDWSSAD